MPTKRPPLRNVNSALLNAVALMRAAFIHVCSQFDSSNNPRAALTAQVLRRDEIHAIDQEEVRIHRARMQLIPPPQRPHYPPEERLAILNLRARAGWPLAETARRFQVSAPTIASWMRRIDEHGEQALLKPPKPINRFPQFVTAIVQQLRAAAPGPGARKLAEIIARAGLRLSASTCRRMLRQPSQPAPATPAAPNKKPTKTSVKKADRVVTARYPNHLWHIDITVVPTGLGMWIPWVPASLPTIWPFCWHVLVVLDHFSRAPVAFAHFRSSPTARQVCAVLDRAVASTKCAPRHIVSDQGVQFRSEYRAWCNANAVKPRFGAVGQHGSIAVIERFFRTLKYDFLFKILIPFRTHRMNLALADFMRWYSAERPHNTLHGDVPDDALHGVVRKVRGWEVRPGMKLKRDRGVLRRRPPGELRLVVGNTGGFRELPVVRLELAA